MMNSEEDNNSIIIYAFIPIVLFVLVFIYLAFFMKPHAASEYALHVTCQSNLKQINNALKLYSIDYNDYFPPYDNEKGLKILLDNGYLKDPLFIRTSMRSLP